MATEVIMPPMGESIAEGTITKWLVQVGERVEKDQPLFEVSTDKVDAEIPSPASGTLLVVHHGEGATVQINELVALVGEPSEQPDSELAPEPPAPETKVEGAETMEVVVEEQPLPAPQVDRVEAEVPAEDVQLVDRIRRFSSPLVRKMAAAEGVDLSQIEGTGIHGRVTKQDMQAFLEKRSAPPIATTDLPTPSAPSPVRKAELVPAPRQQIGEFQVAAYSEGDNVEIESMSKIRRLTAAHMVYSKATSAHVSTVFHVDLSRVARVRARAKRGFAQTHGTKLTFMPFIFKAVANALTAYPNLNSSIDGTDIVHKKDINLGMAVALDWGLLVPVIRHADQLNLVGLAKAANDLAERARSKRLSPEEVQGGTFTVTNPGVFGSLFGTPIINQPQVAILGIGTIEKRPVVDTDADGNDTIAIKTMCYFALTFDHRLIDGAEADSFMNHLRRTLLDESWSELDSFQ
jgi:2-oxoglutarate dehydrogenase E2 component (dihydrolipoamide succinyltransferase)